MLTCSWSASFNSFIKIPTYNMSGGRARSEIATLPEFELLLLAPEEAGNRCNKSELPLEQLLPCRTSSLQKHHLLDQRIGLTHRILVVGGGLRDQPVEIDTGGEFQDVPGHSNLAPTLVVGLSVDKGGDYLPQRVIEFQGNDARLDQIKLYRRRGIEGVRIILFEREPLWESRLVGSPGRRGPESGKRAVEAQERDIRQPADRLHAQLRPEADRIHRPRKR